MGPQCITVVVGGKAVAVAATPRGGVRAMDGGGQASAHRTAWDFSATSITRCIVARTMATMLIAALGRRPHGVVDWCRASFVFHRCSVYRNLPVHECTGVLRAAQELLHLDCEFRARCDSTRKNEFVTSESIFLEPRQDHGYYVDCSSRSVTRSRC